MTDIDQYQVTVDGLIQLRSVQLIADFGAKFCVPCKKIKPYVEELSKEFTNCTNVEK